MFSNRFGGPQLARRYLIAALVPLVGACGDQPTTGPRSTPPASTPLAKAVSGPARILFSSAITGSSELYSIREDGTDLVRLTYSQGGEQDAVSSPDGSKIAFMSWSQSTGFAVYVMNADGSRVRQLTPSNTFTGIAGISWSADGKRIAFAANTVLNGPFDLYIMSSTGAQLTQLTNTADASESDPAFSPTGDRIAYSHGPAPSLATNIWTIPSDGGSPTLLIDCGIGCQHPTWSPDGRFMAYSHYGVAWEVWRKDLLIINAPIVTVATNALHPAFSPDGLKVAYWAYDIPTSTFQVGTSAADGSSPAVLTNFRYNAYVTGWGR